MVHALCALGGNDCLRLGISATAADVIAATQALQADIVMVSFSGSYPQKLVNPYLVALLSRLPEGVEIWIGGAGAQTTAPRSSRLEVFNDLRSLMPALNLFMKRRLHRPSPVSKKLNGNGVNYAQQSTDFG